MYLVVGLGNPGEKYLGSRHNLGFEVLDYLIKKLNLEQLKKEERFKSEVLKTDQLILAKPKTYMNMSGLAVSKLASFFKIAPENIVVIHDDLDLLLGHIKVRLGGGAGGHHGVESIISELGIDSFIRIRLGIGNQKAFSGEHKRISFNAEKFVLEEFLLKEHSEVKQMLKQAYKALDLITKDGVEKAQNQFN